MNIPVPDFLLQDKSRLFTYKNRAENIHYALQKSQIGKDQKQNQQ